VTSEYTGRLLSDFNDYDHPAAPGGLVKCALLCLGLISHPAATPAIPCQHTYPHGEFPELSPQLHATFGGSLEVEVWSVLPQGYVPVRRRCVDWHHAICCAAALEWARQASLQRQSLLQSQE
jgi:hypothetical protein